MTSVLLFPLSDLKFAILASNLNFGPALYPGLCILTLQVGMINSVRALQGHTKDQFSMSSFTLLGHRWACVNVVKTE